MNSSGEMDSGQRTSPGGVEIRAMTIKDMDAVCEVIGLAFAENPSTLANVRGDREHARQTIATRSASPSSDAPGVTPWSPYRRAGSPVS